MTRATIERFTCDRCAAIGAAEPGEGLRNWGRVFAATQGEIAWIGNYEAPADLCDECMDDLSRFMGRETIAGADKAVAA